MKAQLIRDDIEISARSPEGRAELAQHAGLPESAPIHEMLKALHQNPDLAPHIECRMVLRNGYQRVVPYRKNGSILEYPDAFQLVRAGVAIPADEACAERAGMTVLQMAQQQQHYSRLMAGIAPEDVKLFDTGIITGYDGVGDFKHGPNWDRRHELAPERFPKNEVTDATETARALAGH